MTDDMFYQVQQVDGLEDVIKLQGSVGRIRKKQSIIKEEISEMRKIFQNLNTKI